MSYKICTACDIHHYEDCGTCFGFGLHDDDTIVRAIDAHNKNYTRTIPCPECGSTVKGLPANVCQHCGADLMSVNIDEDQLATDEFKKRVLDVAQEDIVFNEVTGWVFWPWREDDPKGYWTASSLDVISNELDRRNEELFTDAE